MRWWKFDRISMYKSSFSRYKCWTWIEFLMYVVQPCLRLPVQRKWLYSKTWLIKNGKYSVLPSKNVNILSALKINQFSSAFKEQKINSPNSKPMVQYQNTSVKNWQSVAMSFWWDAAYMTLFMPALGGTEDDGAWEGSGARISRFQHLHRHASQLLLSRIMSLVRNFFRTQFFLTSFVWDS